LRSITVCPARKEVHDETSSRASFVEIQFDIKFAKIPNGIETAAAAHQLNLTFVSDHFTVSALAERQ
jgi:hypothetical protein